MSYFVLLLHAEPDRLTRVSPEELQSIAARYAAWSQKITAAGQRVGGQKLEDGTGRQMRRRDGRTLVTDGPFIEAKEAVGGYFIIKADSFDQAVDIAGDCPHLDYGTIEVRQTQATTTGDLK
jgi:hypothetical protein